MGNKPPEVIILQITSDFRTLCSLALRSVGFQEHIDFVIVGEANRAEDLIERDYPQLLITGDINPADSRAITVFVDRLRLKNSQLVTVEFSSSKLDATFERTISKMGVNLHQKLAEALTDFKSGMLRRK